MVGIHLLYTTLRQTRMPATHAKCRAQLVFQFMGAPLLIVVRLAFLFVKEFHRPLLELVR